MDKELNEIPEAPIKVRSDPVKLKLWNEYWEKVISDIQAEKEQERRNRRTR